MKNRRSAQHSSEWLARMVRSAIGAVCVVAVTGGLSYQGMWVIRFATSHPYFTLTEITVRGNRRLPRDEVLRLAGVEAGSSIWDASPDMIRANLLHTPWVRDAEVHREFPNGLTIAINERRPAAIVQLDELHYVDARGQVLGLVGADDSRDFPLITGLSTPAAKAYSEAGIRRALRLIRLCARDSLLGPVSEIAIDKDYGATVFPLRPAIGVHVGWGNWRQKLGSSLRVLQAWEGRTDQVQRIDLSFRHRAVVKLKELPVPAKPKPGPGKKGTRI